MSFSAVLTDFRQITPHIFYKSILYIPQVERDKKVNKLSAEKYAEQKTEILIALVKLRAPITQEEEAFLNAANSIQAKGFINADSSVSGAHSSGKRLDCLQFLDQDADKFNSFQKYLSRLESTIVNEIIIVIIGYH